MRFDIAVIGGGASGLAAAIEAKRLLPQSRVAVIERSEKVGKKILATGNGRCNLGNRDISAENYHGSIDVMSIIAAAPSAEDFFGELGLMCVSDEHGRLYPRSNAAGSVLSALRLYSQRLGAEELCGAFVRKIEPCSGGYSLLLDDGREVNCRRVIIAAGGCAAPQFGTDGAMLGILRSIGYRIVKPTPAVAPLMVKPELLRGLKGVRVKGTVSTVCGGKVLARESGEIQFTERTISGICVFDLAHLYARYGNDLVIRADLAPDMSREQLLGYLRGIRVQRAEASLEELLSGMLIKNLAIYLVKKALGRSMTDKISSVSDGELQRLADMIKRLDFPVSGCAPWKNAQTTAGGVHGDCIDDTLESRLHRGIFLCGEILDVDGDCGGYNLQWAWSSGITAARSCARSLKGIGNDKSSKHKRTS